MASLVRAYTRSFERRPYVTLLIANGLLMTLGDVSAQSLAMFAASTSPNVLGGGDSIAELVSYDFSRTFRFAFFGASMGPFAGAWNKFLEVRFPLRTTVSQAQQYQMNKVKQEDPPTTIPIPGFKMPKGARLERGGRTSTGGSFSSTTPIPTPISTTTNVKGTVASPEGPIENIQLVKRVAADQLGLAPISLFIFLMSMGLMEGLSDDQLWHKIKDNYITILLVNWQVWPLLQLINFRFVPLKYRVPYGSILGIGWSCYLSFKTSPPLEELVKA